MFRSPHRPANIGLTLAKVEHVKGDTITMSGVRNLCEENTETIPQIDLIDGTPVLDIKPYIPAYDAVDRSIEDLAEEGEIDVEEAEEEKTLDKIGENDQRADELLQRLQAGEEGIKVGNIIAIRSSCTVLMPGETSWGSGAQGKSARLCKLGNRGFHCSNTKGFHC